MNLRAIVGVVIAAYLAVCQAAEPNAATTRPSVAAPTTSRPARDVRPEFEKQYAEWREWRDSPAGAVLSDHTHAASYQAIVVLGIPALPLIAEKMAADPNDFELEVAFGIISKKHFPAGAFANPERRADAHTLAQMYVEWWRRGRAETPAEFERLFGEWKRAHAEGRREDARAHEQALADLGVAALPCIVEKLRTVAADNAQVSELLLRLIFRVGGPTAADRTIDLVRVDTLKLWDEGRDKWTLPPVDEAMTRPATAQPASQP